MSQKCTSTTCASKTYYNIFVSILGQWCEGGGGGGWGRIECQVDEEKCLKYSFFSILVLVMY